MIEIYIACVQRNFDMVKSLAMIDERKNDEEDIRIVTIGGSPVRLTNPRGLLREFRTVRQLEAQYEGHHVANF